MKILLIRNIGRAERDFHGPNFGDAFEELGHHVDRIDFDDKIPSYDYDMAFHFYHSISKEVVDDLKAHNIITILLLGDEPCEFFRTKEFSPWYDLVFNQTGGWPNIRDHRKLGSKMYPLPHCANPKTYYPVEVSSKEMGYYGSDVAFIGTLTNRKERYYINNIFKDYNFKTWGPGCMQDRWIYPEECRKIYSSSKIIFNPGAVADQPDWEMPFPTLLAGPACRIFNTAAAGAFQVAPKRPHWHFQPFDDTEIAYYITINDLLEKVETYLEEPAARQRMAYNGYLRLLRDHTYVHRALGVLSYVKLYKEGKL